MGRWGDLKEDRTEGRWADPQEDRTEGRWGDLKVDRTEGLKVDRTEGRLVLRFQVALRAQARGFPTVVPANQCRQKRPLACCRVGTLLHRLVLFPRTSFFWPWWHPFHRHGAA